MKKLAYWLFACCAMIFIMVVIGALTRLTHSGLSIVEWKPVSGILPPLSQEDWLTLFDNYQRSPEYHKVNQGMTLFEYKQIFWLEYIHRLWGRLIGLVFLLPLLYFYFTKQIPKKLVPKLVLAFFLGGLQGVIGWYMVKSGLVNKPQVSHYRLALHLITAFFVYGYLFVLALDLYFPKPRVQMLKGCLALVCLVFITVISGGFVAGTRAGFVFNDFPFMAGKLIPDGLMAYEPWFRNFFDNVITVQFQHRVLALCIVLLSLGLLLRYKHKVFIWIMAIVTVQVILGIATLWLHVPLLLAALHQANALILFTAALYAMRRVAL